MGRQTVDQSQLFYLFNLEGRIPARHLLRRINPMVTRILAEFREKLAPFYSEIGRPSAAASAIVCVGKGVSHIVGFSTDGKITFRRKIKRLAVASPLEYKANDCAISMGGPATDIERSSTLSTWSGATRRLKATFWRVISIIGTRCIMPSVVWIR